MVNERVGWRPTEKSIGTDPSSEYGRRYTGKEVVRNFEQ